MSPGRSRARSRAERAPSACRRQEGARVILVAGATGFVGRALLRDFARRPGPPVRALVRREFDAVRLREQGVEAATGDLVAGRGLDAAMRGIDTLVYLAHTAGAPGDPVANDLEAAQNGLQAARAANVRQVVFLGCVAASEVSTARYLVARWAVELAVRQCGLPSVVLRAPIIIGRGGTLFELMRRVVDRSPVVPLFAWRHVAVEPVALGDVVEALRHAVADHSLDGRSFDVCGATRLTFGELVRAWGRASGRHRHYLPLPGYGEAATEQLAWTLARLPRRKTRLLLETLRAPQVCADPSRRFPFPRRPLSCEQALAAVVAGEA
ncbi:MAG: NAD-dependent epimerase/dehydratase family protein [Dehalococcoidia bacterium]|nr:NAD-dependent epimerase/dehydratase family protein [Dehalococcoidia bacterium]